MRMSLLEGRDVALGRFWFDWGAIGIKTTVKDVVTVAAVEVAGRRAVERRCSRQSRNDGRERER